MARGWVITLIQAYERTNGVYFHIVLVIANLLYAAAVVILWRRRKQLTQPIAAAAQPEYELSIDTTTGMSAPPIGRRERRDRPARQDG